MKKKFVFIIGIVCGFLISGISVFAIQQIFARNIIFYSEKFKAQNVDDALNELYEKSEKIVNKAALKGVSWEFDYSGKIDSFIVPITGAYKLETWGAQGGSYNSEYYGGYGGYSVGEIDLNTGDELFVVVGGAGNNASATGTTNILQGGFNGGGAGAATSTAVVGYASGGGATHIALDKKKLSDFSKDDEKLLIVAGGGGGSWYQELGYTLKHVGGSGGGSIGGSTFGTYSTSKYTIATGGTQSMGGNLGSFNNTVNDYSGTLGQGGSGIDCGSGGGGGYFGGASSHCTGGGGGSGYIGNTKLENKSMYCVNCTSSLDSKTKTEIVTCSNSNPIERCGKEKNGYAKITLLSAK